MVYYYAKQASIYIVLSSLLVVLSSYLATQLWNPIVEAAVVTPNTVCLKPDSITPNNISLEYIDPSLFPPPDFKVAFLGDSGSGDGLQSVLDLIDSEGAQLVIHAGDQDYIEDADGAALFQSKVLATLPDVPYFAADGNHDNWAWYIDFYNDQLTNAGITGVDATSSNYSFAYQGLKLVFTKEGGNPTFIDTELNSDQHIWKICAWHKNQTAMQLGDKNNGQGWGDYETCLDYGAIIATAHEHSYSRTRTLSDVVNQIVDSTCTEADTLCVEPGKTFVFVSGLGGKSIRTQIRCLPTSFPYGCNQEWAKIYTSDQGAEYGAVFIDFYVDGNPRKAAGYFKNTNGDIIDQFTIISGN